MARDTTPPSTLPTNKSTTSFFNAISMNSTRHRTTLLSSMNLASATNPTTSRQLPPQDEEDDFYGDDIGVGVKDAKQKAREQNAEQEALRSKMFGKKRKVEEERRLREGSSEDEEGRAGLGSKKKERKRVREADEEDEALLPTDLDEGQDATNTVVDEKMEAEDNGEAEAEAEIEASQETKKPAKKKKKTENQNRKSKNNKKKNKKKKEGAE